MSVEARTELQTGKIIPPFKLSAANRAGKVGPWDYKQRKNLVLFYFHGAACAACRELLREFAANYDEYRNLEAEVLAIAKESLAELRQLGQEMNLPFPLLADPEGKVFAAYISQDEINSHAAPAVAVFVADRYGVLYEAMTAAEADALPDEGEIRGWLEFIEIQCPECHPPEWPQ
ncbi:MAG TPA: redoxin domain-containing protein [Blastocatellia bacterium]|nr:redoxin domain-containing protein [Blastocatellia bacterium]